MSLVRLVIAWFVMAALPLQGMAAAAMLFCGEAGHAAVAHEPGHGHDHAGRDHASHHEDGDHVVAATMQHDEAQASASADDHACPICAACCNLVALTPAPTLNLGQDSPIARPSPGTSRVLTRATLVPDKPPRA